MLKKFEDFNEINEGFDVKRLEKKIKEKSEDNSNFKGYENVASAFVMDIRDFFDKFEELINNDDFNKIESKTISLLKTTLKLFDANRKVSEKKMKSDTKMAYDELVEQMEDFIEKHKNDIK